MRLTVTRGGTDFQEERPTPGSDALGDESWSSRADFSRCFPEACSSAGFSKWARGTSASPEKCGAYRGVAGAFLGAGTALILVGNEHIN